jgi:hypothetical protein
MPVTKGPIIQPRPVGISRVSEIDWHFTVETLEKMACALEAPLYRLFYTGNEPPECTSVLLTQVNNGNA